MDSEDELEDVSEIEGQIDWLQSENAKTFYKQGMIWSYEFVSERLLMLRECYLRKMKSYILFVNTVQYPQSFSSLFELESDKSSSHENSYDESEVSGRLPVLREHVLFLSKSQSWELLHWRDY